MIDPACFQLANAMGLKEGDRVSFTTRVLKDGKHVQQNGEGIVTLIWMGIEEMVDVKTDTGLVTVCFVFDNIKKLSTKGTE